MAGQQDTTSLIDPVADKGGRAFAAHPLRQAAMRLADVRRSGSRLKTKDLIGLLVSHGARAWRASLPAVNVRVRVLTPAGRSAVKIRFQ